ncbi:MAG: RES family NAD+ phosphorylase [Verrucomicrobia bacterium]|nr:RES family NAD+ phosphorylase [Verrucomicrobiota bacterium]
MTLPVRNVVLIHGLRVHGDHRPAIGFRKITTHRFTHSDAPGGLMYLAEDLETCLWECFGDAILDPGAEISHAKWSHSRASEIGLKSPLLVCDLTDLATRKHLGLDLSALNHTDLMVPQAWGLAIQTHQDKADGFLFPSRFTGKRCLVLFDRPSVVAKLDSKLGKHLPEIDVACEFIAKNLINLV